MACTEKASYSGGYEPVNPPISMRSYLEPSPERRLMMTDRRLLRHSAIC
jgi:hypothetical protein